MKKVLMTVLLVGMLAGSVSADPVGIHPHRLRKLQHQSTVPSEAYSVFIYPRFDVPPGIRVILFDISSSGKTFQGDITWNIRMRDIFGCRLSMIVRSGGALNFIELIDDGQYSGSPKHATVSGIVGAVLENESNAVFCLMQPVAGNYISITGRAF